MAFFKRVMDHLLNQVLVETLANSRWFQRFAVHSHKLTKEMAEKSEQQQCVPPVGPNGSSSCVRTCMHADMCTHACSCCR